MNLTDVMRPVRHVLLDFDGPVCSVFGELPAPEVARRLAEAIDDDLPAEVVGTDPLGLLSVFAGRDHETLVAAEAQLRDLEVEAIESAPITPGVVGALRAFRATGRTVTVVSNNSQSAVVTFLAKHDLEALITGVCSRQHPEPELLKPNPFLLRRALVERDAQHSESVMVGDSLTDLEAARATGVPVIAFANKPSKSQMFAETNPPPDGLVRDLAELTEATARAYVEVER